MKKSALNNAGMLLRALLVSTCILTPVWMTGCASASYKKADAASQSLRRAAIDINAENRMIDVTMASLDDLINKSSGDLRPHFERFNTALDELVAASNRAENSAARAKQKSADYFKSWDKESVSINFEAVRDQSVARKAQVSNEFNTVNQRYHQNQAVVEPLISYLKDIRTALSTDLTASGVESVKPLAENARQNAQKVQTALAQLSDELAVSGSRMSPYVIPTSQAQGGVGDAAQSSQQRAESSPSGQIRMTNAQLQGQ